MQLIALRTSVKFSISLVQVITFTSRNLFLSFPLISKFITVSKLNCFRGPTSALPNWSEGVNGETAAIKLGEEVAEVGESNGDSVSRSLAVNLMTA